MIVCPALAAFTAPWIVANVPPPTMFTDRSVRDSNASDSAQCLPETRAAAADERKRRLASGEALARKPGTGVLLPILTSFFKSVVGFRRRKRREAARLEHFSHYLDGTNC